MLSARLAALLHPLGALALGVVGAPAAAVFAVLHGAGNGILTIAKGTLPLVLFGPAGYGHRQGWLMVPARIAQALAPWLFGLLLDRWGAQALWISASIGLVAFASLWLLRAPANGTRQADACGRPRREARCAPAPRRRSRALHERPLHGADAARSPQGRADAIQARAVVAQQPPASHDVIA
jgi:MFS family permease